MSGELETVPVDLADHLTAWLAGDVTVSAWPPDGVGEPAVWVELNTVRQASARRTVEWQLVIAVPAGRRQLLASLTDVVWDGLDSWRPEIDGVAIDANAINGTASVEFVGGDTLPGFRFSIPVTYRPC
jgi:hypothetical protein